MKFFLDTASLDDLQDYASWGAFSGATINPVIMVRESQEYEAHARSVLDIVPEDWDISLEVRSGTASEMIAQARVLASWDPRVRVKIPAISEGLKAAAVLANEMPLNMTIIKSSAQALLCQALAIRLNAKDMVVSVFCGRLRQAGHDWHEVVATLAKAEWPGKVLAASIKTPADIADAISLGADIVTAPPDAYKMALSSSLVDEDVKAFDEAFDLRGLLVPGTRPGSALKGRE